MNDSVGTLSSITSLAPQTSCYNIPRASLSSRSTTSSSNDSIKSYDYYQKYHHHHPHPQQRRQSDFAKVHDAASSSIMKWNKLEEGSFSMPSSMTSIASFSLEKQRQPTTAAKNQQFSSKLKNLDEKIPTTTTTTEGSFSSLSQDSSTNSLHVSKKLIKFVGKKVIN